MSTPTSLTADAYDGFLAIIDDTLAMAKEALDLADAAGRIPPPQVTLTKVASETYSKTAKALHRTGVFSDKSEQALEQDLRAHGEAGHLEIMEKLASKAAFLLDVGDVIGGELVEKSAKPTQQYAGLPNKTAVWQKAWDEAGEALD